jgi:hypothetical protein
MAVTRKDARKTRRITRSVAAANAGKPSDIPSNHIEPAPSTGKKACSATSNVTEKEGIISTGAKQMVTRSMANSNTPRVTWSKDGQKIQVPLNTTSPTPSFSNRRISAHESIAKKKKIVIPTSTRVTKFAPRRVAKAADAARKT